MGQLFTFEEKETIFLWGLAEQFQAAKTGTTATDKRSDHGIENVEMHYIGLKAQYAIAKILGCDFDRQAYEGKGRETSPLIHNNQRVAVYNRQQHLVVERTPSADVIALTNPAPGYDDRFIRTKPAHKFRDLWIVGWITIDEYLKWKYIRGFPAGDRWVVTTSKFHKMDDLIEPVIQMKLWE